MCNSNIRLSTDDTILLLNSVISRLTPTTLLDIGCGDGHYHNYIVPIVQTIVGIDSDISPRQPSTYSPPRSILIRHDITHYPYPIPLSLPTTYDIITILDVLEHLQYPEELLFYLKDNHSHSNTYFFISVPNVDNLEDRLKGIPLYLYQPSLHEITEGRWCKDHIRFFNVSSLIDLLTTCNLEPVYLTGSNILASSMLRSLAISLSNSFQIRVEDVVRCLGENLTYWAPNICVLAKVKGG